MSRVLGPGLVRAALLLFALTTAALCVSGLAGALVSTSPAEREALIAFHGYALAFFAFVVGFMVWARARAQSAGTPRVLLLVALFFAFVGPWIVMAIAGVLSNTPDRALVLAAPSPTFTVAMVAAIKAASSERPALVLAGTVCAAAWAVIGAGLLALGSARAKKRLDQEAKQLAEMHAALEAEDAAQGGPPAPATAAAEPIPDTAG